MSANKPNNSATLVQQSAFCVARMLGRSLAGGLVLAALSSGAMAVTECNGPPLSGTIPDGVVVNGGDVCFLVEATVYDSVQVNPGGVLITCGSTIYGGLVANGAANLIIGAGADEEPVGFVCPGNNIRGGVQISNTGPGVLAPAPSIAIERDIIAGGVHLSNNAGPVVVSADVINGGLFCNNNASDLDDEGTPSVVIGRTTCEFGE
ncbi:MAG TPA: hypothetical protein VHQ21_09155 [Rhodanobacteraceae bacterium]|nr:hypothetical protein [Rhodanobacteraceae bacterium]